MRSLARSRRPGPRSVFPLLLTVVLAGLAAGTTARAEESPGLGLGLSAALLRSSVQGFEATNGEQVESTAQGSFAVRYRVIYATSERLFVEGGIGYASRGGEAQTQVADPVAPNIVTTDNSVLDLALVEFPILVRYLAWVPRRGLELEVFAGPNFGLVVQSEVERTVIEVNTTTGENETSTTSIDAKDATSTLLLHATLGAELTKSFEDWRASLFVTFDQGLNELLERTSGEGAIGLDGGKSRGLSVGVSVSVRI